MVMMVIKKTGATWPCFPVRQDLHVLTGFWILLGFALLGC
jgi:hypothetical protein